MKSVEYLQQARSLVEKGWCQGTYYIKADGTFASIRYEADAYCMMGAMERAGYAERSDYWRGEFLVALCALQEVTKGADGTGIITWNDAPERTKEEVLAAFDAAIKELEK